MGVVLELPDDVLATAREALDPAAGRGVVEVMRRRRLAPPRVRDHEPLQYRALHVRRQVAADRLDLGQLGHLPRG